MKKFSKLYKKTVKSEIQEWEIWIEENVIHEQYGLQNGKKQHITDTIKEGKNIGRANETTREEQAELEAQAKWTKKREKEYRETIEELSEQEKTSSFGGYLPMLAHKYKEHGHKIKWPCYCQPKLDGLRSISIKENNQVTLWFRSGKQVKTMKHIEEALNKVMQNGEIWDGELYIHNEDFNKLGGSIRKDVNLDFETAKKVEYHIYDFPRIKTVDTLLLEHIPYQYRLNAFNTRKIIYPLVAVETAVISNEDEMKQYFSEFIEQGYEGVMIRNIGMAYEQKRSYDLLKYKAFDDSEFLVVGYEEGRGQLAGAVGSFICQLPDGQTFKAKLKGKDVTNLLVQYFKNPKLFMGKQLTVQYQGLSKDGIPRFPVGVGLRMDK
jgi:DNA ligase-1